MGIRVTSDTRDPRWVSGSRGQLTRRFTVMAQAPYVVAAASGPQALDRRETRRFMVLIGNSIIRNFPHWIEVLLARVRSALSRAQKMRKNLRLRKRLIALYKLLERFLRLNRVQERHHWKWWFADWSGAYGLTKQDFEPGKAVTDYAAEMLEQHLEHMMFTAPLVEAVASLNLVIESLSAELSAIVYKGIGTSLSEKAGQWLKEHAEGDPEHSADAWEFVKRLAAVEGRRFNLVVLRASMEVTADLFNLALQSGYRLPEHRKPRRPLPIREEDIALLVGRRRKFTVAM